MLRGECDHSTPPEPGDLLGIQRKQFAHGNALEGMAVADLRPFRLRQTLLGLALSVVPLGWTPLMEPSRIRPEAHEGELLTFIRVFAPKAEKKYETATDDFDQGVPPP